MALHDNCLLGGIGLAPKGELGYWLHRDAWGQGFATEAGLAILDYGRNVLQLPGAVALTDSDNTGSKGVLRKLGFTQTADRRLETANRRGATFVNRFVRDFD